MEVVGMSMDLMLIDFHLRHCVHLLSNNYDCMNDVVVALVEDVLRNGVPCLGAHSDLPIDAMGMSPPNARVHHMDGAGGARCLVDEDELHRIEEDPVPLRRRNHEDRLEEPKSRHKDNTQARRLQDDMCLQLASR
jgi:hypothetical protein